MNIFFLLGFGLLAEELSCLALCCHLLAVSNCSAANTDNIFFPGFKLAHSLSALEFLRNGPTIIAYLNKMVFCEIHLF